MPEIITTDRTYCIEDAHTRSNTSSNTHDSELNIASVAVGRHSSGYQCYGFFKFAPHGIPENAVIVSAEFGGRVYERLQAKEFELTARPAGGAWTDTEITYKTMPTSAGVSDKVALGDEWSYFSADITAIAQSWFGSSGGAGTSGGDFDYDNGLYITSSEASSYKRIFSCTAAEANRPYIVLTYYVPASRPTLDADSAQIAAGTVINIATNRLSDDYTHALAWSLGGRSGQIAAGVTDAYAWTLTDADVSALLAALPSATSGTLTVVCETFDAAGASLGTESVSLTATIPESVKPTISEIAITGLDLGLGVYYLQGVSRMQVDVSASPGAGSAIASVIVTVDGAKYSGASITTGRLTGSGNVGADVTVTDARGRTASGGAASTVPIYAYSAPKISAFAIDRCSADGAAAQIDGEHLRLTLDASSSLIAMPSVNPVSAQIYTKLRSETEWTLAAEYGGGSTSLALENAVLPGVYSPLSSYDVRIVAADAIGLVAEIRTVIPTATSLTHYDAANKRVTFGRIGESADPAGALITALDLIAEAGVSLHGADIVDGRIELPDGGMIAASASFAVSQSGSGDASPENVREIRTLESVQVTATTEDAGSVLACAFGAPVPEAEIDFAAGKWTQSWGYAELDGTEDWSGYLAPSGSWLAWMRPALPAALTPAAETGNAVCNVLAPVAAASLPNAAAGGITTAYNEQIVVTAKPADTSVVVGGTIMFSVAAQGEGLTYRWQYRKTPSGSWANSISSYANIPDFSFTPAADYHDGYQYRCVITDSSGNQVISDYATLTITTDAAPAIMITANPADQTARVGTTARFAVAARGDGLTYQWEYFQPSVGSWKNSGTSGNTTAEIRIATMSYQNDYQYRCVITDSSGNQVTSDAATLYIGEKEGEPADIMLSVAGVTTAADFAAYLADLYAAGTPVQVAYRLAEPVEHALAPQLIAAPAGPNILTTNADALAAHAGGGRIFYTLARAVNARTNT